MCRTLNTPGFRFLQKAIQDVTTDESLEKHINAVKNCAVTSTKLVRYRTEHNTHRVYGKSVYIPDYLRTSFTRLRLMLHRLKVETGRWSRIPRNGRICQCD